MFNLQGGLAQCADKRGDGDALEASVARQVWRAVQDSTRELADRADGDSQQISEAKGRLGSLEQALDGLHEQVAFARRGHGELEVQLSALEQWRTDSLVRFATVDRAAEAFERRLTEAMQDTDVRMQAWERRLTEAAQARMEQLQAAAAMEVRVDALERLFVDLKSQPAAATGDQVEEVGQRLMEMRGWLEDGRLQGRVRELEKKVQEGMPALERQLKDLAEAPATRAQVEEVGARLLAMSGRLDKVEGPLRVAPSPSAPKHFLEESAAPPLCSESTCSDEASRQLAARLDSLERAVQDSGGRLFKAEVACRELRQRSSSLADKGRVEEISQLLNRVESFSQERFDEMAGLVRNMGGQVKVVEATCTDLQKKLTRFADREHVEAVQNKLDDMSAFVATEPGQMASASPERVRQEVQKVLGDVVGRVQGVEAACQGLREQQARGQEQRSSGGHRLLSRVEELEQAMANVSSAAAPERRAAAVQSDEESELPSPRPLREESPVKQPAFEDEVEIEEVAPQPEYPPDTPQHKAYPADVARPIVDGDAASCASTWDAVILLGTPALSTTGSIVVGLLTAFTTVAQCVFLAVTLESFSSPTLVDGDADVLAKWRTGASASTWTCDESLQPDAASPGKSLVALMESYWGTHLRGPVANLASGPALCIIACLLWHAAVLREARSAVASQLRLWALPRGDTALRRTDGRSRLESIGRERLVVSCVLSMLRLALTLALAFCGTLFLTATLDGSELLVRFLALRAILEVGTLLLSAAAPAGSAKLARELLPSSVGAHTLELPAAAAHLGALVAGSLLSWFLLVGPQVKVVELSLDALCG